MFCGALLSTSQWHRAPIEGAKSISDARDLHTPELTMVKSQNWLGQQKKF